MADTTLVDQKIKTLTIEMNEEMGVYFPADVTEDYDLAAYDDFFVLLRQNFFLYNLLTKEQVQDYFVKFYNAEYADKLGIINTLKNQQEVFLDNYTTVLDKNPDAIAQRNASLYQLQPDKESKAELLFFLSNGFVPSKDDNLAQYQELVDSIEAAVQKAEADLDKQAEIESDDVVQSNPEEVVSRYLKGSGVYDPALRNTGFRVDTDIEKANGPQV